MKQETCPTCGQDYDPRLIRIKWIRSETGMFTIKPPAHVPESEPSPWLGFVGYYYWGIARGLYPDVDRLCDELSKPFGAGIA